MWRNEICSFSCCKLLIINPWCIFNKQHKHAALLVTKILFYIILLCISIHLFSTKQNNHSNIKPLSLVIWNLLIEVRKRGAHLYRFYFNGQNWKLTQFYKTCVLASKAATSALQPAHWTLWTGPGWLLRWTESSLHPGNTGGHAVLAPVHCRTGASCRSVGWEV